ncbi:MAG: nuclear transport factor 2 family protein [Tissierellales bacterium]
MQTPVSSARHIVSQFLENLGEAGDTEALVKLLSPQISVDTPYSPPGQPTHFEGIDEVAARFAGARSAMQLFRFLNIEILATEDPERWVATCDSEGQHIDGRSYANTYCWIFRIKDGQIHWWCEYYNPQPLMVFMDVIEPTY